MRTIPALLRRAAHTHGDRIWLRTDEDELSFRAATSRIGAIAAELRSRGINRGDIVVLTARNEPRYLLALLAVTTLGATAVPVNPKATVQEWAGLLEQLDARLIVTDSDLSGQIHEAKPTSRTDDVDTLTSEASAEVPDDAEESDIAIMIQTSGTTGRSKLVMQTHQTYVLTGEGFPYWMRLDANDRMMTSLPLFHTNALAYSTMGSLSCGASLILLPRFSASGFLDAARAHGATSFNAVGGLLELLLHQTPRADDADNPLRTAYTAPSPPKEQHLEIEQQFGIELVCGYGMSESPYGLIWRSRSRPYGTLGWPRQHPQLGEINTVRVVDDHYQDVAVGDTGELLLNNPTVTPGYYGMPEETAATLDHGWLRTGDLVTPNSDGTYTFVARKKEVIRRRGENLAPAEVEQTVREHPDVAECVVIGVPDGLSEEEVKAYVRRVPGSVVSPAELRDWTAMRLAGFKIPKLWQFVDDLPRTATGRVAKHQLPTAADGHEHDLANMSRERN